jgi:hypothetical protein
VDQGKAFLFEEVFLLGLHEAIHYSAAWNFQWTDFSKRQAALQIAQGMVYLHAASPLIVHGDLRPTNVKLTDRNICRITGFRFPVSKQSMCAIVPGPCTKSGSVALHY